MLKANARYQYSTANVLQNIVWGAGTQSTVDALLARVAMQMQKATFIYATLNHSRQADMAAQIDYVARRLDPNAQPALSADQHLIPAAVVARFRIATQRKPPDGFRSAEDFPFRTGYNTLVAHLTQSTIQAEVGERQTIHQYLSLLKAQWLLQTIKSLPEFANLRDYAEDRKDVQDLENKIVKERTRPDLTYYSGVELESLPTNHFFIWEAAPKNVLRNRMLPFGEEKEIMSADLPVPPDYEGCRLVVFRDLANKQGTRVRLARQWARNGELLPPDSTPVDAYTHILKPLYTVASLTDQPLSIEICNADGTQEELYEFKDLKDVFKLQWALTSYAVFSDFEDVDWGIARSMKSNLIGKGSRIQMWWYDPDDMLEKVASDVQSPASKASGNTSILSRMTGASGKAILQDSESQRLPTNSMSTSKHSQTEIIEALPPYEPLLVVYHMDQKQYEYLCLTLHGQVYIEPAACDCIRHPQQCLRSVIRSGNNVKCQIKRVSVPRRRPKDTPNLNLFARSYLKGTSHHPRLDLAETVSTRDVVLDFGTARQRQRFNQQFEFILRLQRSREATQGILAKRAEYLSNKPRGEGQVKNRITGCVEPRTSPMASVATFGVDARSVMSDPGPHSQSIRSPIPAAPKPLSRRDSAVAPSASNGNPFHSTNPFRNAATSAVLPHSLPTTPLGIYPTTSAEPSGSSASSGSQTWPRTTQWTPHSPDDPYIDHPRTESDASASSALLQGVPIRNSSTRSTSTSSNQASLNRHASRSQRPSATLSEASRPSISSLAGPSVSSSNATASPAPTQSQAQPLPPPNPPATSTHRPSDSWTGDYAGRHVGESWL